MEQLIEVIAKNLVDYPDEVVVSSQKKDKCTVVELKVNEADMGKVIGRNGSIAKAIRTVLKAYAMKSKQNAVLDIVNN